MKEIQELVQEYLPRIREYRCRIHENPEVSHEERETAAYIAACLRELGLEPTENVGGYGVTALIRGARPGKCAALRADFDALPIREETGAAFASKNEGVMHACGHDTHAAMLLGAAAVLNAVRDRFAGTVKLIFQPSEEDAANSGAKAMIADGVLEEPHVDAIFAQHIWPNCETGEIIALDGPVTAASDRFFVTVKGKSSHGSAPEDGVDAIVIAAQVISALQTVVSRSVAPLASSVVTVGKITGGDRYNIIAETVRLEGTCRNLQPEVRERIPELLERTVRGVTEAMGGGYEFRYLRCYSPTVNDPAAMQYVRDAVAQDLEGRAKLTASKPSLTGEDVSFFAERVPCANYWLGCHKPGTERWPLHSSHFLPDEDALPLGVETMVTAALRYLSD